jgi:hypothetical protein
MSNLIITREHRIRVARRLTKIFDQWELGVFERVCLLGIRRHSTATLERYSRGCPLAQKAELLERAVLILEIHLSLDVCFGAQGKHRDWLCEENQYLSFETPLMRMRKGLEQLRRVRNLAVTTLVGRDQFKAKWIGYFKRMKLIGITK